MTSSLISSRSAPAKATELHAKASPDFAAKLAETLRQTIQGHPFPVVERQCASFGVTGYCPGDSASEIVSRADAALYLAKTAGRNCVRSV